MRNKVRRCFQDGRSKTETSNAIVPEFMDAFPYDEGEQKHISRRIKGSSDRIYDEYRTAAKNKGKSGDQRRKRRRRRAATR
jgi:hypothetical protein